MARESNADGITRWASFRSNLLVLSAALFLVLTTVAMAVYPGATTSAGWRVTTL